MENLTEILVIEQLFLKFSVLGYQSYIVTEKRVMGKDLTSTYVLHSDQLGNILVFQRCGDRKTIDQRCGDTETEQRSKWNGESEQINQRVHLGIQ